MDITRPFLDYLRKFVDLTDEEYQHYILPYIKVRRFGKKEVVIKANEIENYFNFVLRGMARKYYKKGKDEINTQISFENHIIHSQESYHSRTPSEYYVEAIEPTTFVSITRDDLEKIYDSSKKMEHLWQAHYHLHHGDKRSLADAIGKTLTERTFYSLRK